MWWKFKWNWWKKRKIKLIRFIGGDLSDEHAKILKLAYEMIDYVELDKEKLKLQNNLQAIGQEPKVIIIEQVKEEILAAKGIKRQWNPTHPEGIPLWDLFDDEPEVTYYDESYNNYYKPLSKVYNR